MYKKYIPDFYAKNIFEIPVSFFKENNFKIIFSDLDNTLDSYKISEPSQRVKDLIKKLTENDIELIIISNNRKKRIEHYSSILGIRCQFSCKKPFPFRLNGFIDRNQLKKNEIVLIGDQLITDVRAARNLKLKVLLTEPIVKEDQPITTFNRFRDRIIRSHLKKKKVLQNMEVKNHE